MQCIVTRVTDVRLLGDNLSVVSVDGIEHHIVANRREDGSLRWEVGEPVIYVPEDAVVPEDVLKSRGYWNDEKQIGSLGGKKGNRVKMRRFGPEEDRVESRGLLFKVSKTVPTPGFIPTGLFIDRTRNHPEGIENISQPIALGDDVSTFLGIE